MRIAKLDFKQYRHCSRISRIQQISFLKPFDTSRNENVQNTKFRFEIGCIFLSLTEVFISLHFPIRQQKLCFETCHHIR